MHVYEVFRRERPSEAMRHAGNLRAPDDALALHYAKEFYGRRGESIELWVVPRAAIVADAAPAEGAEYEVFRRGREGEPMRHVAGGESPGDRPADGARWLVPRAAIVKTSDPDLLKPPLDRSYRVPAGYKINEKLDEARRRAGTQPPARDRPERKRAGAAAE